MSKINVCIIFLPMLFCFTADICYSFFRKLSFGLISDVSRPIEAMLLMLVYNLNCLDLNHQFHYFCELKISSVLIFQHTKFEQPQNSNKRNSVLINETFSMPKNSSIRVGIP